MERAIWNWKAVSLYVSMFVTDELDTLTLSKIPPFRLAASVSLCWSWEKEGRAVEVVPGIYAVHWKFSMCTATIGPVHTARLGRVCLCFACLFVLFYLFVSPFFCVSLGSWVISLTVLSASVTNLNGPLRALAMWVRSYSSIPFGLL